MPSESEQALALDERARREALDLRRSLLLQAPAGSGKTTVLTARFLAALAQAEAPEELLAITFTRKAAAEMRERILKALSSAEEGAAAPGVDPELLRRVRARDRERGWELERNPARLRIETIDALYQSLARALPVAARAGGELSIAGSVKALYRRAARQTLLHALHDEELGAATERLYERLDNRWERLESLLAQMLERRTHWLPRVLEAHAEGLPQRVRRSLAALLRAELAGAAARLPEAQLREAAELLSAIGSGGATVSLAAEPACLREWQQLCALALTEEGGWRQRITAQQGVAAGNRELKARIEQWLARLQDSPGAREALDTVRRLPEARLGPEDEQGLEDFAQLLMRAAAELQLLFAERGKVDFAYVAAAAHAALREQDAPSDLALRIGLSLRHILVDEFQDTSYEQFELLRLLSAGWERGDGRTLFLVGDPMQSIYQFREAEVGLFLRARDVGIGEISFKSLELRRNFRSRASLIDWVNRQFTLLFPRRDDLRTAAVRYLPSVPAPALERSAPEASGPAVRLHRVGARDALGEAQRVVTLVRAARERDQGASIAVLVAAREHADAIVTELAASGFRARGVNLRPLAERSVIRELSALTRALLHGADRGAWLALLRGPCCGLTLAELEALVGRAHDHWLSVLEDAARAQAGSALGQRLSRLCAALAPVIEGVERSRPLWQRVERSWLRLAGPAVYTDADDRIDTAHFLEALSAHDAPETLAGEALEELTRELYAASAPRPGAIDVLTMHAAKGLEWDVVILPGLGRQPPPERDPLLHWIELPRARADSDLLLAPIRSGPEEPRNSLGAYIKRLRRERQALERVRLLYVATTRARCELHLLGALESPRDGAEPKPPTGSLLERLWPALRQAFLALPEPADSTTETPRSAEPPLQRLPLEWRAEGAPPAVPVERLPLALPLLESTPEYRWVGQAARAVGTIVHAELRRLAEQPPRSTRDYQHWLAELDVPAHERVAATARIHAALERTLADERGRWLLSSQHREARSEWRLTGLHGGRLVTVVFDRMLLDEHGQRWIVDFKTSTHEGGALEEFLDAEAERYRGQLERYAALAAQLGPEPLRLALYFPLLGMFREITLPQSLAASSGA
jgi:ATP-dependent exoDNAse (exonuclease V) beta subunit